LYFDENAKTAIHDMNMAPTKADGLRAFEGFVEVYEAKFPKACECLKKDKEQLFAFYDFPAMHWQQIRTTNPIYTSSLEIIF
jgi:transposase-like protein